MQACAAQCLHDTLQLQQCEFPGHEVEYDGPVSQLATQALALFEDQAKSRPSLRDDVLIMEGANGDQLIIAGTDDAV